MKLYSKRYGRRKLPLSWFGRYGSSATLMSSSSPATRGKSCPVRVGAWLQVPARVLLLGPSSYGRRGATMPGTVARSSPVQRRVACDHQCRCSPAARARRPELPGFCRYLSDEAVIFRRSDLAHGSDDDQVGGSDPAPRLLPQPRAGARRRHASGSGHRPIQAPARLGDGLPLASPGASLSWTIRSGM